MKLKFFNFLISTVGILFGLKLVIKSHNGEDLLTYNAQNWNLIPFPEFKGAIYNTDNLATTNNHNFVNEPRFIRSRKIAEQRWPDSKRNISWRLKTALWASGQALKSNHADTIFVECGTGRGYMAAAIADYFNFNSKLQDFYLIDIFSNKLIESDGCESKSPAEFAYSDDVDEVSEYFKQYQSIKILKGLIPNILIDLPKQNISFLHIDLNNATAEIKALEFLKHKFISGTIILFDDYGGYGGDEQAAAHDLFAAKYNQELLNTPTGQAIIIWQSDT